MKWSQLPHRYKGAELGGIFFAGLGSAVSLVLDGMYDTHSFNFANISQVAGLGFAFGYSAGAIADLRDYLDSSEREGNTVRREGKLETVVAKTEDSIEN